MIDKMISFVKDPKVRFKYLAHLGFYNWMSDDRYLKKEYYCVFGKELNLDSPKTFNEKLQWLKLHDRKDKYTKMVDKAEVKKYVSNVIGDEYVIPTIGIYDRFEDIDFDKLPNQFVIKCTHDSGGIVICKDKSRLDVLEVRKRIRDLLKRNFYLEHREWPYKNVKPRIIVEKYMEDKKSKELTDYKFMCFNGRVKMIFTCTERFGDGLKVTFFDLNWNKMPFERHYPSSEKNIEKPRDLNKMILLSEKLSRNIPFVRIDWYDVDGRLYFGEFTFYPGGGLEEFTPDEWDKRIGDYIDLGLVAKGGNGGRKIDDGKKNKR